MRKFPSLWMIWVTSSVVLGFMPSALQAQTSLPEVIASLQNESQIVASLDVMSRLCDESCVPYVSDLLRHHEPEIVKAACLTAHSMAHPRLAAPLLDVVLHHPLDAVRDEALRALISQGRGVESLWETLDPSHPDEIQLRMIRNMPQEFRASRAKMMAKLAQNHAFTTSVIAAYRQEPEPLMAALLADLFEVSDRTAVYRAIVLLCPFMTRDFLTPDVQNLFWHEDARFFDDIAYIQASRLTPDAMAWLLHVMPQLTDDEIVNAFTAFREDKKAPFFKILSQERELWERLKKIPALQAQWNERPTDSTEEILHGLYALQISAMHQAASHPEILHDLRQMIQNASDRDAFNAAYLARWVVVVLVSEYRDALPDDEVAFLRDEATTVIVDSRRLHAEPALELLHRLGETPTPPEVRAFQSLRADMKRAWLRAMPQEDKAPYVRLMIEDGDENVVADALEAVIPCDINPENLCEWIQTGTPMVSLQAAKTAARLGRTDCLQALEQRLVDPDIRVAYGVIWAMQKLHALPPDYRLKSLYYRAQDGILRDHLGFLSGLVPGEPRHPTPIELSTKTPITHGKILQIKTRNTPVAMQEITVMDDDKSIRISRSNLFGIIDG